LDLEIVRMVDAEVERIAPVLGRAFDEDPLFTWVEPDPERRGAFVLAFMRALAWRSHLFAEALTTAPEILGASLWKGPDLGRLSREQSQRAGLEAAITGLDPDARSRFSATDEIEHILEREVPLPRWYLGVLGVDPEAQGQGLGRRLMQPILERADHEGLPVSLETLRPTNVSYYRRFGFEVTVEGRLAGSGPAFWVMRRPPRSQAVR
jgi:ribosomal protein S18 acetylase RimI-like enzyme